MDKRLKALEAFAADHRGRYPDNLSALLLPDASGRVYFDNRRRPRDPWENVYVYRPPAAPGTRPTLLSVGSDGIEGTEDDIRSAP